MAGGSPPGPVTVVLHIGGGPSTTTVVPRTVGAPATPTTPTPADPPSPGRAGVPTGHLPFTGAPVLLEGTAALGLVAVGLLATITARRRAQKPSTTRPVRPTAVGPRD
jgi:hypothetical protein